LVQLQKDLADIKAADIQVVGISYDPVHALAKFADERKIAFPLLSDEGSKTIDAYGVRNKEVRAGSRVDGVPYPGIFIIDRQGVIRAKLFVEGYIQRPDNADLIKAAKEVK
jgi:peroxiredoxin